MAGTINTCTSGLSCPVCYDLYKTQEENNIPRSLNCGHTYCTGCLEKLVSERNETVLIKCPVCKKEIVLLTPDCSLSLPKNFGLLQILSMNEKGTVSNDYQTCHEHDEPMKVYCHDDKNLICIYCQVYGEHKGHNCQLVSEILKATKEPIINFDKRHKEYLNRLTVAKTQSHEKFTSISESAPVLKEQMRKHFEKLHLELEKREQLLNRHVHRQVLKQGMVFLTHETKLDGLEEKCNELKRHCHERLKNSDYSFLVNDQDTTEILNELTSFGTTLNGLVSCPPCKIILNFDESLVNAIKSYGQTYAEFGEVSMSIDDQGDFHEPDVPANDPSISAVDKVPEQHVVLSDSSSENDDEQEGGEPYCFGLVLNQNQSRRGVRFARSPFMDIRRRLRQQQQQQDNNTKYDCDD